ncbi:potassium-transporting ATPase subunit KdpC [Arthrobacter psychrochitiniphilus]|uniref:Potassium-transporting ATPase KdpC subunit n=1 Tax=Arthrobacter psychrochitiniphilus TaxID=291045 RepID=A0A2V3DSW7_9MICC|nr:potassium-transporting ATPase subunit KdpC [Arthrobacter psychrochitiniphilus]NYG18780.1 K+-transporting ATPase ATPase C chain [Arthrobacter psychrochitiniphilus]PXA66298.1 potassium-transporting ATPase subunit C [Arthrobacter psychrochitiniphilus]
MNAYGRQLFTALRFLLCTTVVLGLLYPALVFGLGQLIAPAQANGSIVSVDGKAAGSSLLAQPVTGEEFFYPRPSAVAWDAGSSSASNLGPNQPALMEAIETNRAEVAAREKVTPGTIPLDALTASGSGLDPQISVAYAQLQRPRVARATGLGESTVSELIRANTNNALLGFLGQPSVNTTTLNAALLQARTNP